MRNDTSKAVRAWTPPWWLRIAAGLLVVTTFLLVAVGGGVTSLDAGMDVPDWPGTFGYNMFLAPIDVWAYDPETRTFFKGRFFEHFHRLMGALVGVLAIVVWLGAWFNGRVRDADGTQRWRRPGLKWASAVVLGLIVVQGLMGGFRVSENSVFLAGLHGILGQLVLAGTVALACLAGRGWRLGTPASGQRPAGRLWLDFAVLWALMLVVLLGAILAGRHDGEDELIMWRFGGIGGIALGGMAAYLGWCGWRAWRECRVLNRQTPNPSSAHRLARGPKGLALVVLALITVQLVLGVTVRHAKVDKAIPDAPLSLGEVVPPVTDAGVQEAIRRLPSHLRDRVPIDTGAFEVWLQYVHRLGAVVVLLGVALMVLGVWQARHRHPWLLTPAIALGFWTGIQLMLGLMTVWSNIYPTIASGHQAVGALLIGVATLLAVRAWSREALPQQTAPSSPQAPSDPRSSVSSEPAAASTAIESEPSSGARELVESA